MAVAVSAGQYRLLNQKVFSGKLPKKWKEAILWGKQHFSLNHDYGRKGIDKDSSYTLLGSKIILFPRHFWVDDFPFTQVEYVSSLEGIYIYMDNYGQSIMVLPNWEWGSLESMETNCTKWPIAFALRCSHWRFVELRCRCVTVSNELVLVWNIYGWNKESNAYKVDFVK